RETGRAQIAGEGAPQVHVVRLVAFHPRQERLGGAPVAEQVTHARAQVGLDVRVEQVRGGHRGRSFQATAVSVRGSAGRPSTRSAMMLRSTSDVPPSMELPLLRRYRYPA